MSGTINTIRRKHNGVLNAYFLWNVVFGMTLLVYTAGLFVPIMEPDAAVYAQVSMEMHDRGDYLSIYHKGVDWLDKPHFPFWMSALSYKIFGVNTFAYKLPAVIFILLGAFYTYLFGKKFYSALHGKIAVIILITAEHIIISNQDVRAEPFMTGLMIMGLYHFACLIPYARKVSASIDGAKQRDSISSVGGGDRQRVTISPVATEQRDPVSSAEGGTEQGVFAKSPPLLHMILASFATACLIMTKGLFTIIPLASGIGLSLLYQKNWKAIFHWRWLIVSILTLVFLMPAIYGYYQQFDKHPEKIIFGEHDVSGVTFFLWTSQWGRFTNTGPIKGKGDLTFFIHTMLWAFLPWAFAAFFALFNKTKQLIKKISYGEQYTFFGFITLFLIFSASRFQLSFYLNPLFPLLAIVTAAVLINQSRRILRIFSVIHLVLSCLLVMGLILLHYFFSADMPHWDTLIIGIAGISISFYLFSRKGIFLKKIIFATALVVLSVNYYLNRDFYPALLQYQAESEAAYFMRDHDIPANEVLFADEMESVADVILHHSTKVIAVDSMNINAIAGKYVFTTVGGRKKIDSLGLNYTVINEFEDFPVTRLSGKFINRKTRSLEVKPKYLLKTGRPQYNKPVVEVSLAVRHARSNKKEH